MPSSYSSFPYLVSINAVLPAILAGNAVLLKPSPQTPLTAERFALALTRAGVPADVIQVLHLSPELVVRHLIKQAALHSVEVLKDLQTCPEYVNSKRSGRNLRKEEAERMLLEVCLPKNQFMIILDGLDECSEQLDGSEARQHLIRFLNLAAKDARVLVASRHLADIESGLCCTQLTVRAPEANLREYVVERLAGLEKRMPLAAGLTPAVIDKVVKDADGM